MGRKKQKKSDGGAIVSAARFLQRGDLRQALKQARVAERESPDESTRELLQRVTIARARELLESGHRDQCRDLLVPVVRQVKSPDLQSQLPELLFHAALLDQFPEFRSSVSDVDRQRLEVSQFDRSVQNPECATNPELRRLATLIRQALECVEAGKDDTALYMLQAVPRKSGAADWRYFVRGLIAWYRFDRETQDANWERLDPARSASRIVKQLSTDVADSAPNSPFSLRIPESLLKTAPELRAFANVQLIMQAVANENWRVAFRLFRESRSAIRTIDPECVAALTQLITDRIIKSADADALRQFRSTADALPEDPNWNRARAIMVEREWLDEYASLEEVEEPWVRYIQDIDNFGFLSGQQRQIAKSLVWGRLVNNSVQDVESLVHCTCGESHDAEVDEICERAIEFFDQGVEAYPRNRQLWDSLIELYNVADDTKAKAAACVRMLEYFPDDLDALRVAGRTELHDGDPERARELLLRAYRLKPLDDTRRSDLRKAIFECSRQATKRGDFVRARECIESTIPFERVPVETLNRFVHLAVIDRHAGETVSSENNLESASRGLAESTAAHLLFAIEARLTNLPKKQSKEIDAALELKLKARCHAETAGLVSTVMGSCLQHGREYSGRDAHVRGVKGYIKRATRVRYTADKLIQVCAFLHAADDDELHEKFAKKGARNFPEHAMFHILLGEVELAKGPFKCKRKQAFQSFTRALELARASDQGTNAVIIETAQERIAFLERVGFSRPADLFGPFGKLAGFQKMFGAGEPDPPTILEMMESDPELVFEMLGSEVPPELLDDLENASR